MCQGSALTLFALFLEEQSQDDQPGGGLSSNTFPQIIFRNQIVLKDFCVQPFLSKIGLGSKISKTFSTIIVSPSHVLIIVAWLSLFKPLFVRNARLGVLRGLVVVAILSKD